MKKRAVWNDVILAVSDDLVNIEGNYYFPKNDLNWEFFEESKTHSNCYWKGEASYYHLKVQDAVNQDAAWYYPNASDAAKKIEDRVAFWKGVHVEDVE